MNKVFKYYILVVFFVSVFSVQAGNDHSTQMKIGYTLGGLDTSLGRDLRTIVRGAIQFPASYMAGLKGNKIVKVRLGIGDPLTEQQNLIFISNKLDGEPNYVQTVAQLNSGWNDIVLDTPFDINGEEIFIGFKYVTSGMSLSFDGGVTNNYANWVSAGETEGEVTWARQNGSGCLNLQAIVEGNNLPQNNAAIYAFDAKKYAQTGGKYPVKLWVRNMGASDITKLDITCNVEGQESVLKTFDNLSIQSNDIATVSLDNIIIQESSIYDISFKIDQVNGVDNENIKDNQSSVSGVVSKAEYTHRKVLLEQFSTVKCSNCPAAHKVFDKLLKDKKEDVIWLIHHSGFYKDDLTINESVDYIYFYGAVRGYAPAAMLDRSNLAKIGALNGNYDTALSPVFGMGSDVNKLINERINSPALITVNIDSQFEPADRTLTVSTYGEIPAGSVDRLKGTDVRLNIYLVEDSIPGLQEGVDGEYIHNHAIRKVLTDVWGDKIELTTGKYHSKEYIFTLPDSWKERHMRVIAFFANSDQNNPNNAPIYNAEEVELIPRKGDTSVKSEKTGGTDVSVYTASDNLFIKGDYKSAVIYNVTGDVIRMIHQPENKVSLSALVNGLYFVKFDVNGTSTVRKFLKY